MISSQTSLASLQMFGQLVCRLAVSPYTRWEAMRTGPLEVSGSQYWARLAHWRLELWPSSAAYRRGEQPVSSFRVDRRSVLIHSGDSRATLLNEGEEGKQASKDRMRP